MVETNKFRMSYNEVTGEVSLLINQIGPGDEGEYTCTARNQYGEAICSVYIQPEGTAMPTIQPVHHQNVDRNYSNGYTYTSIEEEFRVDTFEYRLLREVSFRESITHRSSHESDYYLSQEVDRNLGPAHAPQIAQKPRNSKLVEGSDAVFSARVGSNPKPRLTWFKNGQRLQSSNKHEISYSNQTASLRIRNANVQDAGHYTLLAENTQGCVVSSAVLAVEPAAEYPSQEPRPTVAMDSGEYTCRATNHLGSAHTSACVRVIDRSDVVTETQNEMSLEQIQMLEESTRKRHHVQEDITVMHAPQFTRPLHNIETIEGTNVHLECRLQPVGDPTMVVEWFVNGHPVKTGHRFRPAYEFDYVALDLLGCYAADSGVYTCQARNQLGESVTSCSIHQLERPSQPRQDEPERIFEKPIFTQLLTGPSELWEGQHAHFEARVVPVGDPSLKFEWYINGVELKFGSRLRTTNDFGFVTLDISSVVQEDSGVYMCRAFNAAGEAVSSTAMKVKTKSSIVGEPLIPESWEAVRLKEAAMNRVPVPFVDSTPQQAPVFTTHLTSHDKLTEGQNIRLEAQVEPRADANLRIEWFKNGVPLTTGARIHSTYI
uniref:Ig-like domain-containing protein n=1 Tax=Megaselia scalaris TaxID=36166 RepID=T1GD99_MEGSC